MISVQIIYLLPSAGRDTRSIFKRGATRFSEGSWVQHETPEEGRRTYQPKLWQYNNEDEGNSPNIQTDKNYQASSQKFRRSTTSSKFSSPSFETGCYTKVKKSSLLYCLIAKGRWIGFIISPRVLSLCEMSRIWTGTIISYENNYYTTNASDLNIE